MEKSKAKLVLTIIKKKIYFEYCEVFGSIYSLKEAKKLTIDIPEYIFRKSKERKVIKFKLMKDTSSDEVEIYKFNVYYGINKAYCFLDLKKCTFNLYEICFYKTVQIKYNEELLTEKDFFDNDSRSRIILINSPNSLYFDDILYPVDKFKLVGCEDENSFEVAFFNPSKQYFATKLIKEKEEFSVIQMIKMYEKDLVNLYDEIKQLLLKNENNEKKYLSVINRYSIYQIDINLSKRKSILMNEFKNEEDYRLMYLYMLWYAIGIYYKQYTTIYISIIDLLDCFETSYKEFLEDKELLIYERIMLIYSKILYIITFTDINEYRQRKLVYIKNKKDKILPKSVFGICFNFINEFIKNLTPQSYLFYPLLLLDSGIYEASERKTMYGFNMETCEIIKSHLNELIPEVFFVYEKNVDFLKKEEGFNFKGYGVIFINKLLALNNYVKDPALYEYNDINEERINK